ncbi:VOC family protein [Sphingobium sp. Sx8-8]|uniref:VOC family protein n=1 Tax=Sphingobium sp. Sx8-8 TaxID=2933617 RepID=UPI001F598863|nr:VOC family protein [Sphingobium sp. Sx8-8]
MTARLLEHYNIRTTRFEETVHFYTAVLGLKRGHYPGRILPGAWIYDEKDVPVVHIADMNPFDEELLRKADAQTVGRPVTTLHGSGAIDHIAFLAVDYVAFCRKLDEMSLVYKPRDVQDGLRQIYIFDPNGILIELNFHESKEG